MKLVPGWSFEHHCSRECPECMTFGVAVSFVSGASGVGRVSGWGLIALCDSHLKLFSWHPFSLPAAAFCAGMGLATCWLQPCSQKINMFLSEMTERGGEGSKIVNMVLLISPLPDLFLIPPSWVLPQPYQIRCEQLLTSWPDGPPCQLSDVTCQSSIFTANLYWSNFTFPGLWS